MRINAKTFRAWMRANFDAGELCGIAEHGAESGWPGITYYTDTAKLYRRFADELWQMAFEDYQDQGMQDPDPMAYPHTWKPNLLKWIADLGGADSVEDGDTFENLMVWYGAERVARELTDK